MKDFTNRTNKTNRQLRKDIQKWLADEEKDHCPFGKMVGTSCGDLCEQLFPKLDGRTHCCPCNNYSLKYVIRIAKEAIKALGG